LVGFHIVTKTRERPQWIWSTFEHVDNVPGITDEPRPPPGVPFSFNNGDGPPTLYPEKAPPSISSKSVEAVPSPMQVVRKQRIFPETMDMNRAYWKLPEIMGTVWQNYMLVMTQWPNTVAPEDPTNDGHPFPVANWNVSNTTIETYLQGDDKGGILPSCMGCHAISNHHGRDFVMFVAVDAFRRRVRGPGDRFSTKILTPGVS
jgi:hypothetical protein